MQFVEAGPPAVGPFTSGNPVPVKAAVNLAGLTPRDVRVEVVMGRIGTNGSLEDVEVMVVPVTGQQGDVAVFEAELTPERTGRLGYALRISPNHFEDPLTRPCTTLIKWGG